MKMLCSLAGISLFLCMCFTSMAQTRPGSLKGVVTDARTGETIPLVNIVIKDSAGVVINGGVTDFDGKYHISPVEAGTYKVEASFTGYAKITLTEIVISSNIITRQNFKMREASHVIGEVTIVNEPPLIDATKSSKITTAEDIHSMAVRDISSVSSKAAGVIHTSGNSTVFYQNPQGVWNSSILGTVTPLQGHPNPLTDFHIDFPSPFETSIPKEPKEHLKDPGARVLTAGEIHDFSKWKLWEDISDDQLKQWKDYWEIAPLERHSLQLTFSNGIPVVDAEVVFENNKGKAVWRCRTDNTGKAELWSNLFKNEEKGTRLKIHYNDKVLKIDGPVSIDKGMNTLQINELCELPDILDISFVVDATGSMTDEIAFLKAELRDVVGRIQSVLNHSSIRTSSVFYRDQGDEYITRKTDFSTAIGQTDDFIKHQHAAGGGDYPEALIEALEVAVRDLEWSEKAVSRIMFLVLDAPPHYSEKELEKLHKLLMEAAQKGIRIIPIASSGIDKRTEYLLRAMALTTNGTYTFLTDHSGVGNPHLEPTTDSYEVELLNDLMVRLIHQFAYIPACIDIPVQKALAADTSQNKKAEAELPVSESKLDSDEKSDEGDPHKFACYPNPTSDVLNLEFGEEVKELFLTDLRGKILQRREVSSEKFLQINLSSYPVGTYFIRFQKGEEWVTHQVIRKT